MGRSSIVASTAMVRSVSAGARMTAATVPRSFSLRAGRARSSLGSSSCVGRRGTAATATCRGRTWTSTLSCLSRVADGHSMSKPQGFGTDMGSTSIKEDRDLSRSITVTISSDVVRVIEGSKRKYLSIVDYLL